MEERSAEIQRMLARIKEDGEFLDAHDEEFSVTYPGLHVFVRDLRVIATGTDNKAMVDDLIARGVITSGDSRLVGRYYTSSEEEASAMQEAADNLILSVYNNVRHSPY